MEAASVVAMEVTAEEAKKSMKSETQKHRIQVSNTKKPFLFYLNLAKKYMKLYNDVELSALGMAIPTVVMIAEILKSSGLAVEKKILTSTVTGSSHETGGRKITKAKIEILLGKTESSESVISDAPKETSPTAQSSESVTPDAPNSSTPTSEINDD